MSNFALSNGDDFPEAAAKNLDDAAALLFARRFDGAAYLAGYVYECSCKTVLLAALGAPSGLPREHGHHRLRDLGAAAQSLASTLLGGSLVRYLPAPAACPWEVTMRYQAPRVSEGEALASVAEAESAFVKSVGAMRLDGVVF